MQKRSTLRRRGFLSRSRALAAALAVAALVVGSGFLGASMATAGAPAVGLYGNFDSGAAEVYLYATSGGAVTSSIPVDAYDYAADGFDFEGVVAGTYAIAFRDDVSGEWLPWLSHTDGSGPDATGGASSCLLNVTVDATEDIDFGSVTLGSGATSSCSAPWGTASSFSGTISNMLPAAAVSAWLYYVDADDDMIPVNHASVGSSGGYSIDGVSLAGRYVVYLEIDDGSPFLDTWSDGSDATEAGNDWPSAPAGVPVSINANTDYSAPAINLVRAAVFSGQVTDSHGTALAGVSVEATVAPGQSGDYYASDVTDANGHYSLRVEPGVRYVLDAVGTGYEQVYWPTAADVGDAVIVAASTAGAYPTPFNFSLTQELTSITGLIVKFNPDGSAESFANITASLYKHTGNYWTKISTKSASVGDSGLNEFNFSAAHISALNAGDFRLRFHTPSGWVAIAEYFAGDENGDPQIVEGPTCFVALPDVVQGEQAAAVVIVDATDTATTCGDEPQAPGSRPRGVTAAHITTSTALALTSAPTPTPTSTATLAVSPSPVPTDVAAPSSSPTPAVASSTTGLPAWLWWALGGLIVVIAGVIIWLIVVRPRI
jgi:hypothetical protein